MKLKLNEQGFAVVRDGKPVYVHSNGREEAFDAAGAMKLLVGKHFETSEVAGSLKVPHEIAAAAFGDSFRIDRGQLVAYASGDMPVFSPTRHGEVANFEEALTHLLERYPNKDMIMRKDGEPALGQQGQTGPTVTRAQFDAMPQNARAKFLGDGGRVGDAASGQASGAPSPVAGAKVMTRAQFDKTHATEAALFVKSGGKVVD
jgi:hypothetical protein